MTAHGDNGVCAAARAGPITKLRLKSHILERSVLFHYL